MAKRTEASTIIITSAVAVVLIVMALFIFSVANSRSITDQNRTYLKDSSSQMAATVDAALKEATDKARILANLLSSSLTSPEVDMDKVRSLMEDSIFDFVEYADDQGWDHTVLNSKTWAGDRKYYTEGVLQGKTGLEIIYNSRATHETLFMFYSPVRFQEKIVGSIIGVYQASKTISGLLTSDYFGETADSYLATAEGRIVASNLKLDPSVEFYAYQLADGDSVKEQLIRDAIDNGNDVVFPISDNHIGVAVTRLPDSGWFLIQEFPKKANSTMVRSAVWRGSALVIFLLLIYALILWTVVRFLRESHKRTLENELRFEEERHRKDEEYRAQLQEALSLAESANRSKSSFLFNMSHDIRTPMNAISGFTTMAKKNVNDPEKVMDYLDKITVAEENLLELINKVLDMSRIESGKIVLDNHPCDIVDRTEALISIVKTSAQMKNIDLVSVCEDIKDRHVLLDGGRFNQIMLNILGNSIKYTKEGGYIVFKTEQLPYDQPGYGLYRFLLEDNGIGMSKSYLKSIFEPFTREKSVTENKIEGTGLGMSIVKRLVDLMGGTIDIQSEVGVGTAVSVVIPLEIQEVQNSEDADGLDTPHDASTLAGKKVLLVEDNELNREIARFILEEQHLVVEEADDGDIAYEKILEACDEGDYGRYDIVLMDIQMPRMNGYEATRQIRQIPFPAGKRLPIIAMTANAFEEDRRNAFEAGMDGHLTKPIDVQALLEMLSKFL